jgi:TetR/AcrR family transcriptional repressor of nem operon
MGRSSRAQAEQSRMRIVDAATALFRRHGVDAVSIADIMKAADMTQGGFYKHFTSKDALAVEACTAAFERSVEAWKEAASQSTDGGKVALRELVAYYFADKPPERSCPMVAFSHNAMNGPHESAFQVTYSQGVERLFAAFSDIARAGGAPDMTNEHISLLFSAMIGANLLASATGNESWTQELTDVVLQAVGPAPRS